MKRLAASAASIMWRMRLASSGRILHFGGAFDFVPEQPTEVAGGAKVDRPSTDNFGHLCLDRRQADQARLLAHLEFHEKVDITVRPRGALEGRAEHREPRYMMSSAHGGQNACVEKGLPGH